MIRHGSLYVLVTAFVVACGGQAAPAGGSPTGGGAVASSAPAATITPGEESPATEPSVATSPGETGGTGGTGATAGTGASVVDPCTIVSREDAAAALGVAVREADVTPASESVARCVYEAEEAGTGFFPDAVELSVETTWATRDDFVSAAETLDAGEPLSGFGEAAFQDVDEEGGKASVSAFAGGVSVYVTLRRAGGDASALLESAKELAQQLLEGV